MKFVKSLPIPITVSITMLLIASFSRWPYGFYTLLRIIICLTSIFLASFAYKNNRRGWLYTMGFIAVLFNPIVKVHFDRGTWQVIDLIVAIIFTISLFRLKNKT